MRSQAENMLEEIKALELGIVNQQIELLGIIKDAKEKLKDSKKQFKQVQKVKAKLLS